MVPAPGEAAGQWWEATGQKQATRRVLRANRLGPQRLRSRRGLLPRRARGGARRRRCSQPEPDSPTPRSSSHGRWTGWPDVPTRVIAGQRRPAVPAGVSAAGGARAARAGRRGDARRAPGGAEPAGGVGRAHLGAAHGIEQSMDIERILRETRSVAIVGASADPLRPSHGVWQYLKSASDYELYLVNPTISEVDGTPVYPSLADLPVVPDLVDVFRRRDHLPSVLADTIEVGAKTLWLQQGLWHEQVGPRRRGGRTTGGDGPLPEGRPRPLARLAGVDRRHVVDQPAAVLLGQRAPAAPAPRCRAACRASSASRAGSPRRWRRSGPIASTPAETVLA